MICRVSVGSRREASLSPAAKACECPWAVKGTRWSGTVWWMLRLALPTDCAWRIRIINCGRGCHVSWEEILVGFVGIASSAPRGCAGLRFAIAGYAGSPGIEVAGRESNWDSEAVGGCGVR
jgi:hypothetical protein